MRHGAHDGRMDGRRDEHALPLHRVDRRRPVRADLDLDEVGLDLLEVDANARLDQPLGEPARARVVVRNPVDMVVQRVQRGGRHDPRLAHRTAE